MVYAILRICAVSFRKHLYIYSASRPLRNPNIRDPSCPLTPSPGSSAESSEDPGLPAS